jgi:hypothetical protein
MMYGALDLAATLGTYWCGTIVPHAAAIWHQLISGERWKSIICQDRLGTEKSQKNIEYRR